MEEENLKAPMIIVMKGLPCTGKSKWARTLARNLQSPIIDQDDVHSCIENPQQSPPSSLITAAEQIDDLSFEVVCRSALTLLQLNFTVIIDCSLHHRAPLDRLLQLSTSTGARLFIIDCRPEDKFQWQFWFEQRFAVDGPSRCWCKPSTWDDLERLVERHDWCSDYDLANVSTLVVDTTADFAEFDLYFAMNELVACEGVHHMELVQWMSNKRRHMMKTPESEGEAKSELEVQEQEKTPPGNGRCSVHVLTFSSGPRRGDDYVSCAACDEPISGPAYNCRDCKLSVHKSCAEFPDKVEILHQDYPPILGPNALEYSFSKMQPCNLCTEQNKGFSSKCMECLFQSHLKSGLLPSVLHHEGHEHPLFFRMTPVSDGVMFHCHACGDLGLHIAYFCRSCNFKCHVKCALLPPTIMNKYHRHPLTRRSYFQQDNSDEFYCDACEKKRNPKHWIYYCVHCDFACHLTCITFLG